MGRLWNGDPGEAILGGGYLKSCVEQKIHFFRILSSPSNLTLDNTGVGLNDRPWIGNRLQECIATDKYITRGKVLYMVLDILSILRYSDCFSHKQWDQSSNLTSQQISHSTPNTLLVSSSTFFHAMVFECFVLKEKNHEMTWRTRRENNVLGYSNYILHSYKRESSLPYSDKTLVMIQIRIPGLLARKYCQ